MKIKEVFKNSKDALLQAERKNANEIKITKSLSPIDIFIQRDEHTQNHSFEYINATSIGFIQGAYLLQNSFKYFVKGADDYFNML